VKKTTKQANIGKSSAQQVSAMRRAGEVTTERKTGHHTGESAHMRKLEDSTEEFKHATVDRSLSQAISQARQAKKMTQKQLATAINEKPQIIQQYEAGTAIPNPQVLVKLDRSLGVHLPRGHK
jgi:putative transcription factor